MRFCSIGSGSRGNAHIIEKGETTLLIECGFPPRTLQKRLSGRYLSPAEISAVLISHEHRDHVAGLSLMQRYQLACYMTAGTARQLAYPDNWQCLQPGEPLIINELTVTPLPVPHDVSEPVQFIIEDGVRKMVILTDLGHVTRGVQRACADADALLVECNYDEEMLMNGPYPESVKARIAGDYGHLSNRDAAALVRATKNGRRRHIIGAHLSEHNNSEALVRQALQAADETAMVTIAGQHDGTDWLQLG